MLRRSQSSVQKFEIQLHGNCGRDDNIVLLSGPPLEASACPLTGQLALTALDTTTIKKISIKLVGTLKLRWADASAAKATSNPPERFQKQLYTQEFSGFDIPGKLVSSNQGSQKVTPVGSLTNLASYFSGHRHKSGAGPSSRDPSPLTSRVGSTTNLAALGSGSPGSTNSAANSVSTSGGNKMHQLPAGTHFFPFELPVPGDIGESIEGNRNAQLTYWLVATIERGTLQHDLVAKKHVRIVRTVGVDSYDIAHTVTIENTWPKKIEYKITVPCKAVPIGSQLEVQFAMIPMDKGLKLGKIRADIVEYVSLSSPTHAAREEQHVVAQQSFEVAPNFDHFADQWELIKFMDVPQSLSRCTQDVMVQPYTKINHKFRCFISLINQDGHTSELRASLPITLYISPNIYVSSNADSVSSKRTQTASQQEVPIFNVERQPRTGQVTPSGASPMGESTVPPVYSHHVYDRLYSTLATPAESPSRSGATSPRNGISRPTSPVSLADLDPSQQAQLVAGLRSLALSRQNSNQRAPPPLSRSNSSQVDVAALSRVPSYDQALNERAAEDTAPEYTD